MKKMLAIVFLFSVYCSVGTFTPEEFKEAVCSISAKYLLKFIECTYDKSPAFIQKFADVVHQCVDEIYINEGKSDSILLFFCHNYVQEDEEVQNCTNDKVKELGEPKPADLNELGEAVQYCLLNAK